MTPFYDYECLICGNQFDKVVSMAEAEANQTCPKCGVTLSRQIIGGFGSYSIKGDNSASTPPKTTVRARKPNE